MSGIKFDGGSEPKRSCSEGEVGGNPLGREMRDRFSEWLDSTGAWWNKDLVEIRYPGRKISDNEDVPTYLRDGWGMMSREKKISSGTVICKVPKDACFCGEEGFATDIETDSQVHLALALMRERRLGPSSKYYDKIRTLPLSVDVCWAWKEDEQQWLEGTELELVSRRKLGRMRREYQEAVEPLGEGWTFDTYLHACATSISHANPWFGVSMVSFVDMGNHDDEPDVEFRQKGKQVVGTAVKSIRPGKEIYQSYGDLGVADLIYRYGFVKQPMSKKVDPIPCEEDTVSVDCELIRKHLQGHVLLEEKFRMLDQWSVIASSPWDGLEDVFTIQLSVEYDGKKRKKEVARGLEELLLAVHVLSLGRERWLDLCQTCNELLQLLGQRFSDDDAQMLSLLLGLQLLEVGERIAGTDLQALVDRSLDELNDRGILPAPEKERERTEGEKERDKKESTNEGEEERQDDDVEEEEEEDEEEMSWRSLLGKYCEDLPLVLKPHNLDIGSNILEERKRKLKADLPEDASSARLHMAKCLVMVECKILEVGLRGLNGLK